MPLSSDTLVNELRKFMDLKLDPSFEGFPQSIADAAEALADAVSTYTLTIAPPSANGTAAKASMIAAFGDLSNMDSLNQDNIEAGLAQFASTLGAGMTGSTTAPAAEALSLSSVVQIGLPGDDQQGASAEDCVTLMATLIDTWFRTGSTVVGTATVIWN
jgi:hypothetical protein